MIHVNMMGSSCWRIIRQPVAFLLLITILDNTLSSSVTAQRYFCYPAVGNYMTNSPYDANLNSVLSSLPTNISDDNGFFNYASTGQNMDRVNAAALCRGDVQLSSCVSCIRNATVDLRSTCRDQMQAVVWYEYCMVRYSNEPIFGIATSSAGNSVRNTSRVSRSEEFWAEVLVLLDDLRRSASNVGPPRKAAAGSRTGPDNQTIFSMVQCTPDLSADDCVSCLIDASTQLSNCCNRTLGGTVFIASCYLRYEIYRFYNETRLLELGLVPQVNALPPSERAPVTPLSGSSDSKLTRNVIIIVFSAVLLMVAVLSGILLRMRMKQRRNKNLYNGVGDGINNIEFLQYDFWKIRAATDDFSDGNKLGQGGFGAVYKGKLPNGKEIAVKRLSRGLGQGDLEFKNEVLLLATLQHRNLVRLLAFSVEGTEKLLVYEFVENGSLDQFIFDPSREPFLDWDKRCKIIKGIARGLLYLHEDSRVKIIHRDLKASNILLDGDMNPKIADFGTGRLFDRDETQGRTSRIVGTYGYMPPEYVIYGEFSVKSDVFSFGVLILEIVSGKKNNAYNDSENIESLLSHVWKNWCHQNVADSIEPAFGVGSSIPPEMLRCIHIGLLCVQENACDRPTMASIVLMLNSSSMALPAPSEPAFCYHNCGDLDIELSQQSNSRGRETTKSAKSDSSLIDASITELYPR